MLNTSKTTKGNKTLDKGVIPFYTKEAFPSDSTTKEDDDVVAIKEKMVSIKLKIDETEGETRTNTYSRLVKSIKNFHVDELEQFMEVFSVLQEEILPELNFPDDSTRIRTFHKYMSVVCEEQAARQWKKIKMDAKKDIISSYTTNCDETKSYFIKVENRDEIIKGRNFTTWLEERKAATAEELTYMDATSGTELYKWLVESFHYRVIDYMNKLIFGEDVHKVLDDQIEYLTTKIIKPFAIGVKVSFERLELLEQYLKFFPPTTKKGVFPTLEAHKEHENFTIAENKQRKIKFNVLPEEAYQQKFITDCEKDYSQMTEEEFLNAAIRFEKSDKVMREKKLKLQKSSDKRKKDSTASMPRTDQNRSNNGAKKRRTDPKDKNAKGVALYCALCKEDGAPQWVYQNHNTKNCNKKEQHEKKLSGGSSNRSSFQREMKKELRVMKKKYKKLKASTRELRVSHKKTKGSAKKYKNYSSSDESGEISDESDDDMSEY